MSTDPRILLVDNDPDYQTAARGAYTPQFLPAIDGRGEIAR